MQVGVHFANFTLPGGPEALHSTLRDTAKVADESGFTWFTLMDHWFQMEGFKTSLRPDAGGLHVARLPRRPDGEG